MADGEDTMMLTIFLKHDQSRPLAEINAQLEQTAFWKRFPPEGIEVVNWYVMMGIGQVAILKVPGHRLREINLAIEQSAWGAFDTEFYPTYDFMPVLKSLQEKHRGASGGTGDD